MLIRAGRIVSFCCAIATVGCRRSETQTPVVAVAARPPPSDLDVALARGASVRSVRAAPMGFDDRLDSVTAVAFSPDGRYLAGAGGGNAVIWRTDDWSVAAGIDEDASIDAVAFAPDGESLYFAGGGTGLGVHAQYDWRHHRVLRRFAGHNAGVHQLLFSRDGRVTVTSSFYENRVRVFDTASGRERQRFPLCEHGCFEVALRPDGKALARQTAKGALSIEPLDGTATRPTHVALPGDVAQLAYTPDGSRLVVVTRWAHQVLLVDPLRARIVEQRRFDGGQPGEALAISADGRLAAVGGAGEVWLYELPSLRVAHRVVWGGTRDEVAGLAFSPDGHLLAIGNRRALPMLYRVDRRELLRPHPGHGDRIERTFFSDDRTLRTYARDGTVCRWDVATMEVKSRIDLPFDCRIAGVRESDGRYVMCAPPRSDHSVEGRRVPVRVVDTDDGTIAVTLRLPVDGWNEYVTWRSGREAVLARQASIVRLDPLDGRVLSSTRARWPGGHPDEDGRFLWRIDPGARGGTLAVERVDVTTGASVWIGWRPLHPGRQRGGLVPDGRTLYVFDPGVLLFDRQTLVPVAARGFDGDVLAVAFTADGSRFAVVSGTRAAWRHRDSASCDPARRNLVSVHDARSARMLIARRPTRWFDTVHFSPDGRRLALTDEESGAPEIWELD